MSDVDKELGVTLGRIRDIAVRYVEKTLASLDAGLMGYEDESSSEDGSEGTSNVNNKDLRDDLGLDWTSESDSESDSDDDRDRPRASDCNRSVARY